MLRFSRKPVLPRKPALPAGIRVYAIGDIHGRADLLQQLFTVIDTDMACSPAIRPIEIFLGDYIDRGPASAATLDLLIERSSRRETVFLKGNHEEHLLSVLRDPYKIGNWRDIGGFETLMSYGIHPPLNPSAQEQVHLAQALAHAVSDRQMSFLRNLQTHFVCGDFCFVHAGIRPGVDLKNQKEADLLWIRDDFLNSKDNFEKYIVHGHTPVREPDIRPNRINIDTGAYATGNLTLLTIQGNSMLAL